MNRCRVLVVDDHKHAQEAICDILSLDASFEVIGVVSDGAEAISFTEQWMPDLILMDIRMSGMGGLEATRLSAEKPGPVDLDRISEGHRQRGSAA